MPIHYAAIGGSIEVASYLCSHKDKIQLNYAPPVLFYLLAFYINFYRSYFLIYFTPLFLATCSSTPEILHFLFDSGCKIEAYMAFGKKVSNYSPIHRAIINKNSECLAILLEKGFTSQKADEKDFSPLMKAISLGHHDAIPILLEHGADASYLTPQKKSALSTACMLKSPEIVKLLLEYGADITKKGHLGTTAVHWAAQSGNTEILRMVIEAGADPLEKDDNNRPPTFSALCAPDDKIYEIMKILLEAGNDVNARNNVGVTIMSSLLIGNKPPELIQLLLDYGADLDIKMQNKKTLYEIAMTCSPPAIKDVIDRHIQKMKRLNESS